MSGELQLTLICKNTTTSAFYSAIGDMLNCLQWEIYEWSAPETQQSTYMETKMQISCAVFRTFVLAP